MVTEPFDIFQKSVGKNTRYQMLTLMILNPPIFIRFSTMQDRNPLKNNNIWCYDIEVVYLLNFIIILCPSIRYASSQSSSN